MNYNSVEEIFAAGTTNMTVLRNNTKQDDGTDSMTGVSWFNFNGTTASTIYANGNSWIGFGSSSQHLEVNRRDGAMYYLYREEGTLYNHYNFLKIRWSGFSKYNSTTASYKVEYDVILWDTGDISLRMISIPTSYNTGVYSLIASSTYTYTVSTASPDVTFKKTDSGFEVQNSMIELKLPYAKRYLIRDGSVIYTISGGVLSSLGGVAVTSSLFLNSGVEDIPDLSMLRGLASPELLYWTDEGPNLTTGLTIEGTPTLPQVVLYEQQTIPSNSAIKIMEAISTDDVLFCISMDSGVTWKYYSDTTWQTASSESQGMTKHKLKIITEGMWAEIASSGTYQIRAVLPSKTSVVNKIAVGYTD